MIQNVKLAKEVTIVTPNKIGLLANISKVLGDHGINIEGVAGYNADGEAKLMIVTNDDTRAIDALKKAGFASVREHEVVLAELVNKPGALKSLTAILAKENIDISYMYGTTCVAGCPARLIVSSKDNEKILAALKK